jgi:hypothetical protein
MAGAPGDFPEFRLATLSGRLPVDLNRLVLLNCLRCCQANPESGFRAQFLCAGNFEDPLQAQQLIAMCARDFFD